MTGTEQHDESEAPGGRFKTPRPDDLRNLVLGRDADREGRGSEAAAGAASTQARPAGGRGGDWGSRGERPPASVDGDWVQPKGGDAGDGDDGEDESSSADDGGWKMPGGGSRAGSGATHSDGGTRSDDGGGMSSGGPAGRRDDGVRLSTDEATRGSGAHGAGATRPVVDHGYESCEHCGAVLDDDSDYCPSCGRLADGDGGGAEDAGGGGGSGAGAGSFGFGRFSFESGAASRTVVAGVPASHLRRLAAYFIDAFILFIVMSVVYPVVVDEPYVDFEAISAWIEDATTQVEDGSQGEASTGGDRDLGVPRLGFNLGSLVQVVLGVLYYGVLLGTVGYTVGKRVMGITVVNASGAPLGVPMGVVRAVLFTLTVSLEYLPFLLLIILLHPQRRALHDLVAGAYPIQVTSTQSETGRSS